MQTMRLSFFFFFKQKVCRGQNNNPEGRNRIKQYEAQQMTLTWYIILTLLGDSPDTDKKNCNANEYG